MEINPQNNMDNQNFSVPPSEQGSQMPQNPTPKNKLPLYLGGIVILVVLAVGGYFVLFQNKLPSITEDIIKPASVFASSFATYKETPVNISPKVPVYSVNQDLGNVSNASDFTLSAEAKNLLVKNAFVVRPAYNNEFFPLYESNRYSYTPNFVTTDSMLHNYHLMFDFLLKQLEEQKLAAELKQLNASMLADAISQYNNLKGTEWENAAKRNVGFFAVGSKLLDSSVSVPSFVVNEVNQELSLIAAHQGISESPVMNIGGSQGAVLDTPQGALGLQALKEDYSQYIPRGHYDKTEQLKTYFKSMMWYEHGE